MVSKYKKISEEILNNLKDNNVDEKFIDEKLKERQIIIDNISESELECFKRQYVEFGVNIIDKEIKKKLATEIIKAKKEMLNYKDSKVVNTTYANMKKNNFNIFSTKV